MHVLEPTTVAILLGAEERITEKLIVGRKFKQLTPMNLAVL